MERNVVLFLVISVVIIIGYSVLFPPGPPISELAQETQVQGQPERADKRSRSEDYGLSEVREVEEPPLVALGPDRTVTVDTGLYRAELSTRGAVIQSWQLKQYRNGPDRDTPIDLFVATPGKVVQKPLGFALETSDHAIRTALLEGSYALDGDNLRLSPHRPTGQLRFEARLPGGEVVSKKLTFYDDSYQVDVELSVQQISDPYRLVLGENFGIREWGGKTFVGYVGPTSLIDGKIVKDKPKNLERAVHHQGHVKWTALQDKYFLAALMPTEPETTVVAESFGSEQRVSVGLQETPSHRAITRNYTLYAGPKEYDRLIAFGNGIAETIDFGWFIYGSWAFVRLIAEPLFLVLKFFYNLTGNYGIAIILLTAVIKIVFIPLTHKSFVSMRAMQTLQPQLQALQKKYKNDKTKLNQEMMALYKTNKVNPIGGCLPMFLQIPFFIALFNILYTTIELRQAPFILWITDLSDKDPSYILPILMGGSMFLQQKLQPTTMDPRQAKLMLFLPIVFTFFFLTFPAGLVLYWMINNLLSITQQFITIRYLFPPLPVAATVSKDVAKKK